MIFASNDVHMVMVIQCILYFSGLNSMHFNYHQIRLLYSYIIH